MTAYMMGWETSLFPDGWENPPKDERKPFICWKESDPDAIEDGLNTYALQGYELVSILPAGDGWYLLIERLQTPRPPLPTPPPVVGAEAPQMCGCGRVVAEGEHHCWFHHENEHPERPGVYRVCGECSHVWETSEELELAHWNGYSGRLEAERIFSCPLCSHDF